MLPSILDLNLPNPLLFPNSFLFLPSNKKKKNEKVRGSWSVEEDCRLKEAVKIQTPIYWDIVARYVGGRTPKQCRERWVYRLNPDLKKTNFEIWEDEIIMKERLEVGNHWIKIASKLPGRTSCAVKNRWYTVLRFRKDYYYLNNNLNYSEFEYIYKNLDEKTLVNKIV